MAPLSWLFSNWRMPTSLSSSLSRLFVHWRTPSSSAPVAPSSRLNRARQLRFKMHLQKVSPTPQQHLMPNPDIVIFFQMRLARELQRQERNKRWRRMCRRTQRLLRKTVNLTPTESEDAMDIESDTESLDLRVTELHQTIAVCASTPCTHTTSYASISSGEPTNNGSVCCLASERCVVYLRRSH
jgi:hypothetical protein